MRGVVVKYDKEKGYGFIRTSQFEEDLFVHISEVQNSNELHVGQNVRFEIKQTPKGLSAVSVIAGRKVWTSSIGYGVVALVAIVITALVVQKFHILISYLTAVNVTTFLFYGYDKYLSRTDKMRIPEKTLHILALIGGSPAGLVAQKFFRHKTLKSSFQLLYWGIVLIQVLLLYLTL